MKTEPGRSGDKPEGVNFWPCRVSCEPFLAEFERNRCMNFDGGELLLLQRKSEMFRERERER